MNTQDRAPLGFADELDNFDPNAWSQPKTKPVEKPKTEETRKAAEAAGFRSREPVIQPPANQPAVKPDRRYRSGRDVQIPVRATLEISEIFYDQCADENLKVVEGFEQAVLAWQKQKELKAKK